VPLVAEREMQDAQGRPGSSDMTRCLQSPIQGFFSPWSVPLQVIVLVMEPILV
jgi:hypothetical protein